MSLGASSTSWPHGRCAGWDDPCQTIGVLGELQARDIDLYLHQQALDTSTPSGRMLFGMLGVFSEFERAMIRDRVMAGLDRARSSGKRLGRPRTTPFQVQRIRLALDEGRGVRETARLLKVSAAKVSEVRRMSAGADGSLPEFVLRTRCFSVRNGRAMMHGRPLKEWKRSPSGQPARARTCSPASENTT